MEDLQDALDGAKTRLKLLTINAAEISGMQEARVVESLLLASTTISILVDTLLRRRCPLLWICDWYRPRPKALRDAPGNDAREDIAVVLQAFEFLKEAVTNQFNGVQQHALAVKALQADEILSLQRQTADTISAAERNVLESENRIDVATIRLRQCEALTQHAKAARDLLNKTIDDKTAGAAATEKGSLITWASLSGSLLLAPAFPPMLVVSAGLGARQMWRFGSLVKNKFKVLSLHLEKLENETTLAKLQAEWDTIRAIKTELQSSVQGLKSLQESLSSIAEECASILEQTITLEEALSEEISRTTRNTVAWTEICAQAGECDSDHNREVVLVFSHKMLAQLNVKFHQLDAAGRVTAGQREKLGHLTIAMHKKLKALSNTSRKGDTVDRSKTLLLSGPQKISDSPAFQCQCNLLWRSNVPELWLGLIIGVIAFKLRLWLLKIYVFDRLITVSIAMLLLTLIMSHFSPTLRRGKRKMRKLRAQIASIRWI